MQSKTLWTNIQCLPMKAPAPLAFLPVFEAFHLLLGNRCPRGQFSQARY